MSELILTIRPEPGSSATVAAGAAVGLSIESCPLFKIRPLPWEAPEAESFDALLLGSANVVRHGGTALQELRHKPVYAVGGATAAAAEKAGFVIAGIGPGVLQRLVDRLRPPLRLLRVTGEEHVPLAPPPGIEVVTRIAYRSEPLPLPKAMADRLGGGALVLLHSAAAARHFATECDRLAVPQGALRLATLGPRITAAAGEGWGEVRAAASADEAALLALARDMCHEPRGPNLQG